ncbi:3-isopropylmalate dehydratase small subunit [Pontivivens ytuae]|uniref:3-isopropylmalate dehydratase n=1 Tax=Pontivivens ytuae TaxID=2789856 RepID=A0A7S9LQ35_9RHOB|nr:3-isopropylmalate dehydratase small subunit [Pontivivens ytuae]QPH53219.1 3-isopropylmalate dehydratase small subunit [Pontivivens ytuae]
MSGWSTHRGVAVALDRESIDTDQLIPARFMSTPRSEGYGRFLLHDLRFDAEGAPVTDFPLNREPNASVLVTRRNFGSGSSREAAVYALVDFGIRAVIAPSFGDIFASNAVNNGLLPARVTEEEADALIASLSGDGAAAVIDLTSSSIEVGATKATFALEEIWRQKLINGWDDIDLTRTHADVIAAYRETRNRRHPWAVPRAEAAR